MSEKVVLKNQFSDCKKSDLVKDAGSIKTETNYKKEHFKPAIAFCFAAYGYGQNRGLHSKCNNFLKENIKYLLFAFVYFIIYIWFLPKCNAMPEKTINLNFFQLVPESVDQENPNKQVQAIKNIFENIPAVFNSIPRTDGTVNLYGSIEKRGDLFLGTLVKNQTSDIPPSYDENNNDLQALPLGANQGLGYSTSFLYDPEVRIIMIESQRNGVSIGVLCSFLNHNFDVPKLDAGIVINPTEMANFLEMGSYNKFQVKMARLENGAIFNSKNRAIGQIIHAADNTNTDTLEFSLTVKKKYDTLSLSKIRNFVNTFLKFKDSEEVTVLKVSGRSDEDAGSETIDFIQQRLKDNFTVEKVRLNSSFSVKEHYDKMIVAYNKHRGGLKIYKLKKIAQ
jgi:hypothetical protein